MYEDILLMLNIEEEKKGITPIDSENDRDLLKSLLYEINCSFGLNLSFLAELKAYTIPGASEIVLKYIHLFDSESVKAYLIHFLIQDHVQNIDLILYQLYLHFRESKTYRGEEKRGSAAHIFATYDNAFKRLKPRRIKKQLSNLMFYPKDALELPLTLIMLSSWKEPRLEDLLINYIYGQNVTPESLFLNSNGNLPQDDLSSKLSFSKKQLVFSGIYGLRYYDSQNCKELLRKMCEDSDKDISIAAKKSLAFINRKKS